MQPPIVPREDVEIENVVARHLSAHAGHARHAYAQPHDAAFRDSVLESWRFPIIETASVGSVVDRDTHDEVTFLYFDPSRSAPTDVAVIGTFGDLWDPIPLRRLPGYDVFTVTVAVPRAELHTYRYLVDGVTVVDPINPQTTTLDNGAIWSRFFTRYCSTPVVLAPRELGLLERLAERILPFRTPAAQRFLEYYYDHLDRESRRNTMPMAYRLDGTVGAVNYIDKILAREEAHRLPEYRSNLRQADRWLRARNPFVDPPEMDRELFDELHEALATNQVAGWIGTPGPKAFLDLLRRHVITGAFSHPKYGGNQGAAGWAWLAERYVDSATRNTLFDWQRAIEAPLGRDAAYRG